MSRDMGNQIVNQVERDFIKLKKIKKDNVERFIEGENDVRTYIKDNGKIKDIGECCDHAIILKNKQAILIESKTDDNGGYQQKITKIAFERIGFEVIEQYDVRKYHRHIYSGKYEKYIIFENKNKKIKIYAIPHPLKRKKKGKMSKKKR